MKTSTPPQCLISIYGSTFSHQDEIESWLIEQGYINKSEALLLDASKSFDFPVQKLKDTLTGHVSIFNTFTHEKEKHLAALQAALSTMLIQKNSMINGPVTLLIPPEITHILKICLLAPFEYRLSHAMATSKFESEAEAIKQLKSDDEDAAGWAASIHQPRPFSKSLYDIKLPMHQTSVNQVCQIISENIKKPAVQFSEVSQKVAQNFKLASDVNMTLQQAGHFQCEVSCRNDKISITIHHRPIFMDRLISELKSIVMEIKGVKHVDVVSAPELQRADIYRKQNFELPNKVLLVDDEKDFVQTLSDRLQIREYGTAVAYSGEEALKITKNDPPEVMLLDLRMPGINGMDVLRKVKKETPEVEVIILTGHGSQKDREAALALGAFAYLEKPTDIDEISKVMNAAYRKIKNPQETSPPNKR